MISKIQLGHTPFTIADVHALAVAYAPGWFAGTGRQLPPSQIYPQVSTPGLHAGIHILFWIWALHWFADVNEPGVFTDTAAQAPLLQR
jgi:hypothetical protein